MWSVPTCGENVVSVPFQSLFHPVLLFLDLEELGEEPHVPEDGSGDVGVGEIRVLFSGGRGRRVPGFPRAIPFLSHGVSLPRNVVGLV